MFLKIGKLICIKISKDFVECYVFRVLVIRAYFFVIFNFLADVNECLVSPCATNANCTNVVGSYTCQCLDGYTGDGLSCAGKRLVSIILQNSITY